MERNLRKLVTKLIKQDKETLKASLTRQESTLGSTIVSSWFCQICMWFADLFRKTPVHVRFQRALGRFANGVEAESVPDPNSPDKAQSFEYMDGTDEKTNHWLPTFAP